MNPFGGIALVLGTLVVLIAGVRTLQGRGRVGAEAARKLVHIGMGATCLSFPSLFTEAWPVWSLAALACGALGLLRVVPGLKRSFGGVLHGVERVSWGELYFPLGVALVFSLARGRPLLFFVPVATLTFADAAGALIGRRFGRHPFATVEGTKSVEGSLAVGGVGLACAAVPLLVTGHAWPVAITIGALIGLFSLLVEAISWRGLDNVFLPLAALAQIGIYLRLSESELLGRLIALVAIVFIASVWRRGRFVDDSARLGGTLALYFFWAVGGWAWLVAPLVLLTSYVRLMPTVPGGVARHNLVAIICVASVGIVWCVANAFAPDPRWLWPFTLGLAAQQAVIAIVRFSQGRSHWLRAAWWGVGVAQGAGLQGLAFGLVDRGRNIGLDGYAWGAAAVAIAAAGFAIWEKELQLPRDMNARWWKQGMAALIASVVGSSFLYP